ncbi:MAG: hypothetical protein AAFV88_25060 [Planctomycetota bacterium]
MKTTVQTPDDGPPLCTIDYHVDGQTYLFRFRVFGVVKPMLTAKYALKMARNSETNFTIDDAAKVANEIRRVTVQYMNQGATP